jgi:hypothetical protein
VTGGVVVVVVLVAREGVVDGNLGGMGDVVGSVMSGGVRVVRDVVSGLFGPAGGVV